MRHPRRASLTRWLFALLLVLAAGAARAGECPLLNGSGPAYDTAYVSPIGLPRCNGQIKKWTPCEVCMLTSGSFTESDAYTRSYASTGAIQPHATFTQSAPGGGNPIEVDGFFDGLVAGTATQRQAIFRIRFTPTVDSGNVHYDISAAGDGSTAMGDFTAAPAPPSATGFLRRKATGAGSFLWDNGNRPFLWGQTLYQIVGYARLAATEPWQTPILESNKKGMNKLRLLVSPWGGDPRTSGTNSKPFVTEGGGLNLDKLDIAHWLALDKVTSFLGSSSIPNGPMVADLILFRDSIDDPSNQMWGTDDQNARYTRYVVARYGAFTHVIWTLANEYQNITGSSPGSNGKWNTLGCIIRGCSGTPRDPWIVNASGDVRGLSIHNNINTKVTNPPKPTNGNYPCFDFFATNWPGHAVLQTKRNDRLTDVVAADAVLQNTFNRYMCGGTGHPQLPVVNDEYYYIGQNTPDDDDRIWHREASWAVAMRGAFGSTGDLRGPVDSVNCAHGGDVRCSPTLYTKWVDEPGPYGDIKSLTDFFRNNLKDVWSDMTPITSLQGSGSARAYGLEKGDLRVVYSALYTKGTTGKYKFSLTGGFSYPYDFYDPRTLVVKLSGKKKVTGSGSKLIQFVTPTAQQSSPDVSDWVQVFKTPVHLSGFSAPLDELPWVADALPAGAVTYGDSEGWNWIEEDPVPISDNLAHASNTVAGMHQHYFKYASETLPISTGNYLYAYVYLDPQSPPSEVMLQWFDGTWEHRAYWGANQLPWGSDNSPGRYYAGPLPVTGEWVRLQVPASAVGLEGHTLNGMAFSLFNGKATWDEAGRAGTFMPQCDDSSITLQPQSQTIIPGASATLSVAVTGTGPFNYQFYQSPVGTYNNPTGISTATISTGPLTTTKQYWAEINDTCLGTFLHSDAAVITVQCTAAPNITQPPTTRTTTPGQTTTLSVTATQAVNYQWYEGSTALTGETKSTLTVSPQSTKMYWVHVTNDCGYADSAAATVCVLPKVTTQPTPRTINPGQSTTLTVTAQNAMHYQWYIGSATSPSTSTPTGTDSSSLNVSPMSTTSYWVRAINDCGTNDSTTVTVTVAPPPPAQITRMQSVAVLANSQNSITATWTRPTQAGTFLVAVISGLKDPAALVWTAPAGWQQAVVQEWPNVKLAIYYLPNNGGARTSETFTVQQGYHDMTLYVAEYSGVMAVNPLDRTASSGDYTNNGYVQTGYTANTVQPKELVITGLSTYTQTEFTVSPTEGFTELYDQSMLYHLTTAMYERITTAAGSYGHSANVYVPAEWTGVVATFRAADTN